jgi:hypothetical protein
MSDPIHITTARPVVIAGYVAPGPVLGYRAVPPSPIDMRWSGVYRITGTTKNTPDHPVSRRVRLHDQRTGDPVREVWSDPVTGAYAFNWIRAGLYYVTFFDHTGTYQAIVRSNVTPTL